MKKVLTISVGLMMAVSVFGQSIKVTPTLKKGMVKTYSVTTTMTAVGQTVNITSEQKYTVTKETSNGFEMTLDYSGFKSDGNTEDLMSRLATISSELLKDSKIQIRLDKEGKVLDVVNYDEVKAKAMASGHQLIDELFAAAPEISQVLKKEQLEQRLADELTQERIVQGLTISSSPLALFGRTITTGMEDKYDNNMVTLKRLWVVIGKKVSSLAKTDMSREELKAYVLSQVEKTTPQQAAMIKDNIDQVLDSGLLKLDVNEQASYELADDLGVKSLETKTESDIVSQKSNTQIKVQLKD